MRCSWKTLGIVVWVLVSWTSSLAHAEAAYRLERCWIPNENLAVLLFRGDNSAYSRISFSVDGRLTTIVSSHGKTVIHWDSLKSIELTGAGFAGFKMLSIRYVVAGDERVHRFDAGAVDRPCLARLRQILARHVTFNETA
jgi:hypothetical protein